MAEGLELADEIAGLAGGVEVALVPVGAEFPSHGRRGRRPDQAAAAHDVPPGSPSIRTPCQNATWFLMRRASGLGCG